MKNLKIIILFLVFPLNVFSQFQVCNTPTNEKLNDIYFINESIGVSVGDNGVILRSIDGGDNWTLINSNINENLKKIKFFDSNNGIIISSSKILISSDAGLIWTETVTNNSNIYDINITDTNTCIISCYPSTLIKSINKGSTFTNITTTSNISFTSISFINNNIGYLCKDCTGQSNLYKTIDGGITWNYISSDGNTIIEGFKFINENIGFKGGWYNGHLKITTDTGSNWNFVNNSNNDWQITDFHIKQTMSNSYYVCGFSGLIGKSVNGGSDWFNVNTNTNEYLYGIYFYNDDLGWVVGADGIILKTTEGSQILSVNEQLIENKNIIIFPNPTDGKLDFFIDNEILEISIYNMAGGYVNSYKNTNSINIKNYANGIYIIYIKTKNGNFTRKLIKK